MIINAIYKKYKKSTDYALNNISLEFASKGLVILSGKSGSGKSTLINIISGLDTNYEGNIIYKNQNLKELSKKELNAYRNSEIGYIFQDFCLLENKTIYENLALSLEIHGSKDNELIYSILEQFGLSDHVHKYPNELSGGEQQRVSIARAILKNPNILIADEPTSSLDEENAKIVLNLLKEISKTKLVLVVTHNLALAKSYADRIIVLEKGSVLSDTRETSIEETNSEMELKSAKLSFKTSFFLSLRLKNNLFRMILTLFLFVICFTLTAISFSFATMDKDKLLLKTMYKNNEYMASVSLLDKMYRSENSKYDSSYSSRGWIPVGLEEKLSQNIDLPYLKIKSTQETPDRLCTVKITFNEYTEVNGYLTNNISESYSGYLDEKQDIYESFDFQLIAGNYPKNDDEVCLPLLIYEGLKSESIYFPKNKITEPKDLLKYTVEIGNKEFKISGVFSVGNIDCSRYEQMRDGTLSDHKYNILSNEQSILLQYSTYSTLIFNQDYFKRNPLDKSLLYNFPTRLLSTTPLEILDFNATVDRVVSSSEIDLKNENIIWFQEPKSTLEGNEVLLPSYALSQIEKIKSSPFDYLSFSSSSLMESILQDVMVPITPVGIYTPSLDTHKDVLVMTEEARMNLYNIFGYWGYPSLYFKLSGDMNQDLKLLHTLKSYNLGISNQYQIMLNSNSEFLFIFTLIMAGLSLIIFLIFLFLIFNYYKNLIDTNKKEIGLLFSLGCSLTKVIRPYLLHALYMTLGIVLLSTGIAFGFYQFLVSLIQNQCCSTLSYSYTLWNSILYTILFYVVISLIVTFFSIWKYYKKNNPLDALRGN